MKMSWRNYCSGHFFYQSTKHAATVSFLHPVARLRHEHNTFEFSNRKNQTKT
jgi:hypothetical protein